MTDFAAWGDEQAELLKAGRFDEVDLPNLIEEIEALSGSQRAALLSQITRITEHLLKLVYSPAVEPRRGWVDSIQDGRAQIEAIIHTSPSLAPVAVANVGRVSSTAARSAAKALQSFDELPKERESHLLAHVFTPEQVLGDWFPGA